MQKVIIIATKKSSFDSAGVGRYFEAYLPYIAKKYDVEFLHQPEEHGVFGGFLWRIFILPRILRRAYRDHIKIWSDESFLLSIRSWMRPMSIAVVHHTYDVPHHGWFGYILWILGWIGFRTGLRRVAQIVTVSETTRRDIIEKIQIKIPITVIPNAFDIDHIPKGVSPQGVDIASIKDKKILLLVATTETRKNVSTMLRLLRNLPDEYIVVRLGRDLAGGDQDEIAQILSEDLSVRNRYVAYTRLEPREMAWWYEYAYCLVCPSLHEGFGRPIIEAQMYGLPVITTTGGALAETIGDSSALTIHDPFSLTEWQDAIETIGEKRQELILRGYQNVRRYDMNIHNKKWNGVIDTFSK